jgi:HemX protein
MMGVPLLLLAIILGVIWGRLVLPEQFWIDAKVLLSTLVLIAYSFWLYKRFSDTWQMRKLALFNLTAFALLLINFLATDTSSFHRWL